MIDLCEIKKLLYLRSSIRLLSVFSMRLKKKWVFMTRVEQRWIVQQRKILSFWIFCAVRLNDWIWSRFGMWNLSMSIFHVLFVVVFVFSTRISSERIKLIPVAHLVLHLHGVGTEWKTIVRVILFFSIVFFIMLYSIPRINESDNQMQDVYCCCCCCCSYIFILIEPLINDEQLNSFTFNFSLVLFHSLHLH